MTNLQFFAVVAIPTLAVLLHYVGTHNGLKRVEQRIDRLEDRIDRLGDRLSKVEEGLRRLEVAMANLRAELYEKFALKSV